MATDDSKPDTYYDGCNRNLLQAIPPTARHLLDVGCGDGRLGEALKVGRPDRTVVGIEYHPGAANRAAERLDRVRHLDLARDQLPDDLGPFDCITCGDIIEHLPDPTAVLARLATSLTRFPRQAQISATHACPVAAWAGPEA
jgi:2-polyprenyl-3-methyl-5-hydroxy-6-metoxy-1,4-benzoquinol methylase